MAKGKKTKVCEEACSTSTAAGSSTNKENEKCVSIARQGRTSPLSAECQTLEHKSFSVYVAPRRVRAVGRPEHDSNIKDGVQVAPNNSVRSHQDVALVNTVWREVVQNQPGLGAVSKTASELQNAKQGDQTVKTLHGFHGIAKSSLTCHDSIQGAVANSSVQASCVGTNINQQVFSDGFPKNSFNADYQFLQADTGHSNEYIKQRTEERRLSVLQHKERMSWREESASDYANGFIFNNSHRHLEDDSILVNEYCKERLGILMDTNLRELATCCHIGQGNVVTCYHAIPPTALYTSMRLKWGYLRIVFPYNPLLVPVYDVCEELPSFSIDNDYAVIKMDKKGQHPWPPAFHNFYLSNENQQEFPIFNVGFQLHSQKLFGELIVDPGVVIKTPSERKVQMLNEYMEKTYSDYDAYGGLLREGNVCQLSTLIQGASGGVGVFVDTNNKDVHVVSMYQRGYPKYYYDIYRTMTEKQAFPPQLKIESGISMPMLFSNMTLKI